LVNNRMDFDSIAVLGFSLNPHALHSGYRSEWMAFYGNVPVYSSMELDREIRELNCSQALIAGAELAVGLKKMTVRNNGSRIYFRAFPLPLTFPLVFEQNPSSLAFGRKLRMGLVVDGMNFLWSCANLKLSPTVALKKIVDLYDLRFAGFYICWDAAFRRDVSESQRLLDGRQRFELEQRFKGIIAFREFQSIEVSNGNGSKKFKDNLDAAIAADIAALYYQMPGLEGIAIVSGDCDFDYALGKWADAATGGPKVIEIIAQGSCLSSRLSKSQIRANFRLLDDCRNW